MTEPSGANAADRSGAILPGGLAACRQFLAHVGQVELALAVVGLVLVVALSSAQALLRYAFGTSLWWAGEIAQYAAFMTYFFGVSYVYKTRQYVLIEFVSEQMPIRVQMIFYCIAQVLAIVFAGASVWLLYKFLPTMLNMRSPVLGLPGYLVPLPLGVASMLMVLTSLYYLSFGVWALARGIAGDSIAAIEAIALVTAPLEDAEEW